MLPCTVPTDGPATLKYGPWVHLGQIVQPAEEIGDGFRTRHVRPLPVPLTADWYYPKCQSGGWVRWRSFFGCPGHHATTTSRIDSIHKPMSTLSIRLPKSIHQHAKRLARDEGISVNQLVSSALAEKLSALDAERYLNERAERGRKVDINAILAKTPMVKPEPHDRIPE